MDHWLKTLYLKILTSKESPFTAVPTVLPSFSNFHMDAGKVVITHITSKETLEELCGL